jgi:hypothetical protein
MCIIGNIFWKGRGLAFVVGVELINKMTNGTQDKEIRDSLACTVYVCSPTYVQSAMNSTYDKNNTKVLYRRVAANILNKQSRTADKGWSSSLGVGRGANNSSP